MFNIRLGLFETNSSSVHSLVIMTKSQYNKLRNTEDLYFSYNYDDVTKPEDIKIKTKEEIIEEFDDIDTFEDMCSIYDFYNFDTLKDIFDRITEVDNLVILSSSFYDG